MHYFQPSLKGGAPGAGEQEEETLRLVQLSLGWIKCLGGFRYLLPGHMCALACD